MMTKKQHPGLNYFSRLMMIPVLFVLLFTFGLKAKTMFTPDPASTRLAKSVTVVIDAGHGGTDAGVQQGEANEKTLTLSIARLIRQLNKNPQLNIVLARDLDVLQPLTNKVDLAKELKADVYISIHINGSKDQTKSGIEAFVSRKTDNNFLTHNNRLATLVLKNLQSVYTTDLTIKQRDQGIYVLDKNICPAVIVELGYLTNMADYNFITNTANQEKLAQQVLKSIEQYFDPNTFVLMSDHPTGKIENENINKQANKDTSLKPVMGIRKQNGELNMGNGQVSEGNMTISSGTIIIHAPISSATKKSLPADVVYTIDGKVSSQAAVEILRPEDIYSVSIHKGKSESDMGSIDIVTKAGGVITEKGSKSKNGALIISTRN